jgi:hypothetical protein
MITIIVTLMLATNTNDSSQSGEGMDIWVLFGSIALFLAIVVAITLLRRLR